MEQIQETIGSRLRKARDAKKLKPKIVCGKTGISKGNLNTLEKDKCKPSSEALIKLSELYGVSTDWILKGDQSTIKETDGFYKLNGLPDVPNKELAIFIKMILDTWNTGDEETKGWVIVQLRRAFPEIADKVSIIKEKMATIK